VALCLAPVFLGAFALVEVRSSDPLLPFALLRRRAAAANLIAMLQQLTATSTVFLAPLFMQQVWLYSASLAGAATLPLPIGYATGVRLSSVLVKRLGVRRLAAGGFALNAIGLAWLSRLPVHGDYLTAFLPALLIRGIGQGLAFMQLVVIITSGIPTKDQGIAAGLYNTSQQLGGALGLAAVATIASAASAVAGGRLLAEAHGIHVAFLVCCAVAVLGGFLALRLLEEPASSVVSAGRVDKMRRAEHPKP
jgi:sugar phosphate permease